MRERRRGRLQGVLRHSRADFHVCGFREQGHLLLQRRKEGARHRLRGQVLVLYVLRQLPIDRLFRVTIANPVVQVFPTNLLWSRSPVS